MSIFGDLDVASASDDPFKVPANTYNAVVSESKVADSKDGSKKGLVLIYTVEDPGSEHHGKNVREWKTIPQPADPKNPSGEDLRAMSFLKARLLDLGVPEERINSIQPDELIGKEVTIDVREGKNDFMNVNSVTLIQNVPAQSGGKGKKFS
jgi:hypothetical protein